MAVTPDDLSIGSYRTAARLRTLLFSALFLTVSIAASEAVFSQGPKTTVILLVGMAVAALATVVFWRPSVGLYSALLLDMIMEPAVIHDPITTYTNIAQLDMNTVLHAGIAFTPIELLLILTGFAYVLRTLDGSVKLRGGALGKPVLIFLGFLVFGVIWGVSHHGDLKIGLFEIRGPFMLVLLYFLVTNLARDERGAMRVVGTMIAGTVVLAIWGYLRLMLFYHGHGGGPDGNFGKTHEDAVFLALFIVVAVVRLMLGGTPVKRRLLMLALLPFAAIAMLQMERRAAFICLYMAVILLAITMFSWRRRLFLTLLPICTVLAVLYCGAFWNSTSSLAQPVRALRSATSSTPQSQRDYLSNLYRAEEKANVRDTIRAAPLTGIGFGRPFTVTHPMVLMPWWPFQFYTPHAEVLWIWLKTGAFGFITFWVIMCSAFALAGRVIQTRRREPIAMACLIAAMYIAMCLVFAYVDVGLALARTEIPLGAMLGVIGIAARSRGAVAAAAAQPGRGRTAHGTSPRPDQNRPVQEDRRPSPPDSDRVPVGAAGATR